MRCPPILAIGLVSLVAGCAGASAPPSAIPLPDRIAFQSDRDGDFDIYVIDADGTALRLLTQNPADDGVPAWSPDGRRIAYASGTVDLRLFDILVMGADGTGVTRLTDGSGSSGNPTWSPDGRRIAFDRDPGNGGDEGIRVMDADGSDIGVLGDRRRNMSPAWSPDGSQIAYGVQGDTDAGIWVMNADGTGARQLTAGPVAAGPGGQSGADVSPAWSPDGSRIAFARMGSGALGAGGAGGTGIWVMNADGTGARQLTAGPGVDGGPAWSPDGTRIAFSSDRDGDFEIYVMDADGTAVTQLTDDPAMDANPDWMPQ